MQLKPLGDGNLILSHSYDWMPMYGGASSHPQAAPWSEKCSWVHLLLSLSETLLQGTGAVQCAPAFLLFCLFGWLVGWGFFGFFLFNEQPWKLFFSLNGIIFLFFHFQRNFLTWSGAKRKCYDSSPCLVVLKTVALSDTLGALLVCIDFPVLGPLWAGSSPICCTGSWADPSTPQGSVLHPVKKAKAPGVSISVRTMHVPVGLWSYWQQGDLWDDSCDWRVEMEGYRQGRREAMLLSMQITSRSAWSSTWGWRGNWLWV